MIDIPRLRKNILVHSCIFSTDGATLLDYIETRIKLDRRISKFIWKCDQCGIEQEKGTMDVFDATQSIPNDWVYIKEADQLNCPACHKQQ